ncbi:glutamate--tRNA ligase [Faecalicatena sp. Marseille-Q4148]|nr:glutamate--tRNA ligase [Faecalicatena sp. Marseille-Q4148]
MEWKEVAALIFDDVEKEAAEIEAAYPRRNLKEGACVTRFAPSPTGYMHVGGLYAALVSWRMAAQSDGVFYLRIEDTDAKREIEDGIGQIVSALHQYGIEFDEGPFEPERGVYGPYIQSHRKQIYRAYVKRLMEEGGAYPCFCTEEALAAIRKEQEEKKEDMGYYGEYAACRKLSPEEAYERVKRGDKFVVRLRSNGDKEKKAVCHDLIKGDIELPENINDVVLLKTDGIPTYHAAHAIDDYLMGTTHVIRGDEWISSYPIHEQLFAAFGFPLPAYAHIAPIMKSENGSKRKLSKRKDPEAAVSYYSEQGYPKESLIEYMLTIANSDYEEWRRDNPEADNSEFEFRLSKMSVSGALFDIVKLNDISKRVIAEKTEEQLFEEIKAWAANYDEKLSAIIEADEEKFKGSIKLWKYNGNKVRRDVGKWSDLSEMYPYLYNLEKTIDAYEFDETRPKEDIIELLDAYLEGYEFDTDAEKWFEDVKVIAGAKNYCANKKEYKANPEAYKGMIADACGMLRVAVTGHKNTPDLYSIIQFVGKDIFEARVRACIEKLK